MSETPILTLTLNPALDIATMLDRVVPAEKLRCGPPYYDPGGGGLNVSRAIHRLGGRSLALVALGGFTGDRLAGLLREEGILFLSLKSPGETRQSLTVTEIATGVQYRFLLPGPDWNRNDQEQVFTLLNATARPGGIAVISGSQPPGVPVDFPARLAAAMPGSQVVLDTSGPTLNEAVAHPIPGLAVLRMNGDEAAGLVGRHLTTPVEAADFAQELLHKGVAKTVIVALGAAGNVLANGDTRVMAHAPKVKLVSAVGAGDSFVAGLVLAMSRGQNWSEALALATATAASAVTTQATELCRPEDVVRLLPQVKVEAV